MARKIAHDFTAAGGVTDVNGVFNVEFCSERRKIVGIVIHVVPIGRLRGSAMTAPIVRDHPIPVREEEHHLRIHSRRSKAANRD